MWSTPRRAATAAPRALIGGPLCDECRVRGRSATWNPVVGLNQCAICRDWWTDDILSGGSGVREDRRMLPASGYGRDVLDWLAAR